MGEKLSVNPARGTAAFTIPLPLSQGRDSASPPLALTYDSAAGNTVFGLGFDVPVPKVFRRTGHGVPTYTDDDVFVLAGGEDLVPLLEETAPGVWEQQVVPVIVDGVECVAERFRPRMDDAFLRIERCRPEGGGVEFWRTVSRDNVTSVYGRTQDARVAGPSLPGEPVRVLEWLVEEVRDDRGNVTVYTYKAENTTGVDTQGCERHRLAGPPPAARYLKSVRYANREPDSAADACLHVVFDYGEHDFSPDEAHPWPVRSDPFSSYRAGFEVRVWRLCRRVLFFHDFPGAFTDDGPDPRLVREVRLTHSPDPVATKLVAVTRTGYDWRGGSYVSRSLPPLEFEYTVAAPDSEVRTVTVPPVPDPTLGLYWVDLDGEGLPGALSRTAAAWYYQRNLGGGRLDEPRVVPALPTTGSSVHLTDVDGAGLPSAVEWEPGRAGCAARTAEGGWAPWRPFASRPALDFADPSLHRLDLDGDGRPDLLVGAADGLRWHRSFGVDGYGPARWVTGAADEEEGPRLAYADEQRSIHFADMTGDGLTDVVRVRNGEVCYWPNLGHGRFGAKVPMTGPPRLDHPDRFHPGRVRLADVDGSGPADLVYLGGEGVQVWPNQAGNAFGTPRTIAPFPDVDSMTSVEIIDLLGTGTGCLVWSSPLPGAQAAPLRYLDLCRGALPDVPAEDSRQAGMKPHLLRVVRNNMGATTTVEYAPATRYYLDDRSAGQPWVTRLPFPVQVIARTTVEDEVSGSRLATRYTYRHGWFDSTEREFRGFGMVETTSAESFDGVPAEVPGLDTPPVRTRMWFHLGGIASPLTDVFTHDPHALPVVVDEVTGAETGDEYRLALRALAGRLLRTEVYADDTVSDAPFSVITRRYSARRLQPGNAGRDAVFLVHDQETVTYDYERDITDPRVTQFVTVEVDERGSPRSTVTIGHPRRTPEIPEQARPHVLWTRYEVIHVDEPDVLRLGVPFETSVHEVTNLPGGDLATALTRLTEIDYSASAAPGVSARRLVDRVRVEYWDDPLAGPLPFGQCGRRALARRTLRMAFTPSLLTEVYEDDVDAATLNGDGGYVFADGVWWAPSETTGYDPAAFYVTTSSTSPFGTVSTIGYDPYHLLVETTTPAAQAPLSSLAVTIINDYRTLCPREVVDPNGDRALVEFDALGLVTRRWARSATGEGDPEPLPGTVFTYGLDAWQTSRTPVWAQTDLREHHAATGPWQRQRTYTDGLGRVAMTKVQAEPGLAWTIDVTGTAVQADTGSDPRWVGTGRTVFNNMGLPVAQYEPYFSVSPHFESAHELVKRGVPQIRRYDALGRMVSSEAADGTVARIAFTPWEQIAHDANDAVEESRWYAERQVLGTPAAEQRAAALSLEHAGTPAVTVLDALGRAVRSREDNGPEGVHESAVALDIQGNLLAVTDAEGRRACVQRNDLLGRLMLSDGIDTGRQRTLLDCQDRPLRTWTPLGHIVSYQYDALRRPVGVRVRDTTGTDRLTELTRYGEEHPEAAARHLRGRVLRTYDQAGMGETSRYDFRGNPVTVSRTLAADDPDWSAVEGARYSALDALAEPLLTSETFTTGSAYDALNRTVRQTLPDGTELDFAYNQAGLTETVTATSPGAGPVACVTSTEYDEYRRRCKVAYGNGVVTTVEYEPHSTRLRRITTRRGARLVQDRTYTHDAVGHIVEVADAAQQTVFFDGSVAPPVLRYTYDALYRLRSGTGREHASLGAQPDRAEPRYAPQPHPNDSGALRPYTETYTYDRVGNLTELKHAAGPAGTFTRTCSYVPGSNRLLAHSRPGGRSTQPFTYDAGGNTSSLPGLPALTWDHGHRLVRAIPGGGGTARYTHDAAGARLHRVWRRKGGVTDQRLRLGSYEVFRRFRGDVLVLERRTVHVEDGTGPVALIETLTVDTDDPASDRTPRCRYQLADHLGSSMVECDDAGEVIAYEEYHPYGSTALWQASGAARVSRRRYRYCGREKDEETGLYHHGARYYACWLGRWLSPDPLLRELNPPPHSPTEFRGRPSPYAGMGCDPVNRVDPDGRQDTMYTKQLDKAYASEEGATRQLEAGRSLMRAAGDMLIRMRAAVIRTVWDDKSEEGYRRSTDPKLGALPNSPDKVILNGIVKATPSASSQLWLVFVAGLKTGPAPTGPAVAALNTAARARSIYEQILSAIKLAWGEGPATAETAFKTSGNVAVARVTMAGRARIYVGIKVPEGTMGAVDPVTQAPSTYFPTKEVTEWARANVLQEGEELAGVTAGSAHAEDAVKSAILSDAKALKVDPATIEGSVGAGTPVCQGCQTTWRNELPRVIPSNPAPK
jgi:RHS repeat-associated protein